VQELPLRVKPAGLASLVVQVPWKPNETVPPAATVLVYLILQVAEPVPVGLGDGEPPLCDGEELGLPPVPVGLGDGEPLCDGW